MKTTNLFKAVAFVTMTIVSVMNTEVKAQENNFITNEEVKNELVVAKTIFKQDGAQLYRHIRYEYSYDDQKRLTCKEASKVGRCKRRMGTLLQDDIPIWQ